MQFVNSIIFMPLMPAKSCASSKFQIKEFVGFSTAIPFPMRAATVASSKVMAAIRFPFSTLALSAALPGLLSVGRP